MNYLEQIISEARASTNEYVKKEIESFFDENNTDNSIDFSKFMGKMLVTLQTQNAKVLYQVLNQLSKDGYLSLPEIDESDVSP